MTEQQRNPETLLYGIAAGETERYMETLLLVTHDTSAIETVKGLAARDGFHSFRTATYTKGEAPRFGRNVIAA